MPVTQALPDGPYAVNTGTPGQDVADVVAFLQQKGNATDEELRGTFMVYPSGDASGVTDRANINSAITSAAGGGTVVLTRGGPWYIDQKVTVPSKVNLWGQGDGELEAASRIICTAAAAGIAFGTRTTGGRGGVSGNFCVDGNDLSTQPLYVGLTVQRTFLALEVTASAGDGLVMEGSQNNTFVGFHSSHHALAGLVWDYGAAGNRFYNAELDSCGTWFIHSRQTGTSQPGLSVQPFDNHVYGGIAERVASQGCVWNQSGDGNGVHDMQLVNDSNVAAYKHVKVDANYFIVDGGIIQSNISGQGTAFQVASGAGLLIKGQPTVVSVGTVIDNSGVIDLDGLLRQVGTITTQLVGNRPRELVQYGYASMGSIPVMSTQVFGLGTTLATVPASWWLLDPAIWPVPERRVAQYRVHVQGIDLSTGDTLSAVLINASDGSGMMAEFSSVVSGVAGGSTTAVSPWLTMPTAMRAGYVQVRNATAARGLAVAAFIEVRAA